MCTSKLAKTRRISVGTDWATGCNRDDGTIRTIPEIDILCGNEWWNPTIDSVISALQSSINPRKKELYFFEKTDSMRLHCTVFL